jgi:hypothetical protein
MSHFLRNAGILICLSLTSCAFITYPIDPREEVSVELFQRYYEMAQYIDHRTLPVGLDYLGRIGNHYVIAENTNRKSILGFIGGEEIALIKYIQVPVDQVERGAFPDSCSALTKKPLPQEISMDDIYVIWIHHDLPLPILKRATLDYWNISSDSVLQPEKAQRYNTMLLNAKKT